MWTEGNIFDDKICRFCGAASKKLHNIHSDQLSARCNAGNSLSQLIKRLVPLKIDPLDRKPQQVCNDCIATLEKYDSFISACLTNDMNFDNVLQSVTSNEIGSNSTAWSEEKWKETHQNDNILVFDKINEPSIVQHENVYIIVELNCKGINIDPVILRSNENNENNKTALPVIRICDNNSRITESKKTISCDNIQLLNSSRKNEKKIKQFKCTVCNKSLTRKSNLISHLALHSEDRPHRCNECGKNFAVFADLTLHKHIHTQSYSCNVCNKCFVTKSKLERHGKSHTGVKEHACPICKKRFSEKNNMTAHLTVHTGERPFVCSVCKKSFRTQSHLTDHGKVHSADSPFKCTLCDKSFKWKSNLKDHSKFHSGEKFKCSDCMKEFSVRTCYYKHRKECRKGRTQLEENSV